MTGRACPAALRPAQLSPLLTACARSRLAPIPAARFASRLAFAASSDFKPSRQRVPTEGAFPLSTTLDFIGPLARSVADCALGLTPSCPVRTLSRLSLIPLPGLRFGIAQGLPLETLDDTVSAAFAAALKSLGARLVCGSPTRHCRCWTKCLRSTPMAASCSRRRAPFIATGSNGAPPISISNVRVRLERVARCRRPTIST